MSAPGHSRRFEGAPTASGLPPRTDILGGRRQASKTPLAKNRQLKVGQSMPALPGSFRHQLVRLLPGHQALQRTAASGLRLFRHGLCELGRRHHPSARRCLSASLHSPGSSRSASARRAHPPALMQRQVFAIGRRQAARSFGWRPMYFDTSQRVCILIPARISLPGPRDCGSIAAPAARIDT